MRKQLFAVIVAVLAFASTASAQIKIEGPKEATVGYRTKAKLTLDVTDPQIKCFPANDDWMGIQDFAGTKYIDFVPGKKLLGKDADGKAIKSKLYTFVVAGNKANKTYLETWEVIVYADGEEAPDVPVPPKPPTPDEITKTQLYKDMLAAYQVNPSATSKATLLEVYGLYLESVKNDKFMTNREADADLRALTKKYLPNSEIQGVRDTVADYLLANVGKQAATYNKAKLQTAMERVIATLKAIP